MHEVSRPASVVAPDMAVAPDSDVGSDTVAARGRVRWPGAGAEPCSGTGRAPAGGAELETGRANLYTDRCITPRQNRRPLAQDGTRLRAAPALGWHIRSPPRDRHGPRSRKSQQSTCVCAGLNRFSGRFFLRAQTYWPRRGPPDPGSSDREYPQTHRSQSSDRSGTPADSWQNYSQ
jgi:hypothetical protein